ncbi:MAG: DUF5112 domain-containing protein, partial [Bacteroidaceae bacterium]|nr:DUF5112 domain-containing protein [Bacteroidaceae bacterium]
MRRPVLLCLCRLMAVALLSACAEASLSERQQVEALNEASYEFRYRDIDSCALYADSALRLSVRFPSGRAEALNNKAFVAYQQMYYDSALALVREVQSFSQNQIELLCGDVMTMKIAQRVGEGKTFFDARHHARWRIRRIQEEAAGLPPHILRRFQYAQSELLFVSATYHYYLGQDSLAIAEMDESLPLITHTSDTAQWLYYHYMLGSGGILRGISEDVCLQEFDHLMRVYQVATDKGYTYFIANALQSLAIMVGTPWKHDLLRRERPSGLSYLFTPMSSEGEDATVLARASYEHFRAMGDLYQCACVRRTLGELYFQRGEYSRALAQFEEALGYVSRQSDRSHLQLPQWMVGVHEQLSLTYSALGDEAAALRARQSYCSLLASTSQNSEWESRREHLEEEVATARLWLWVLVAILMLSLCLALFLLSRMKRRAAGRSDEIRNICQSAHYQAYHAQLEQTVQALDDTLEEVAEQTSLSRMTTARYRGENIERRAKVAMVYSIIPYLDRILASVSRLRGEGQSDAETLTYIAMLSEEITRTGEVLTDWIQMTQGRVRLHITTFPLQEVLSILEGSRSSFEKKAVALRLQSTPCVVKADKALTLFMVNTLMDNARKFTPAGGTVTVYATEGDGYVEVSVADTGVGLSAQDVATINESKVYDPTRLGDAASEKGFGFGVMNCKGIIGKYRKTSDHFRVCDFGLESEQGRGSRFWFRLPRIASVLLLLVSLCLGEVRGQGASSHGGATPPSELAVDTLALLRQSGDSAVAAMLRHDWEAYRRHNDRYVHLHHLYTADATLPVYCARMQQLRATSVVLYAFLVLASLLALLLFYLVVIRPRLTDRKAHRQVMQAMHAAIAEAMRSLQGEDSFEQLRCPNGHRPPDKVEGSFAPLTTFNAEGIQPISPL